MVKKTNKTPELPLILTKKCEIAELPTNARREGRVSARFFGMKSQENPAEFGTQDWFDWFAGWAECQGPADRLAGDASATVLPMQPIGER